LEGNSVIHYHGTPLTPRRELYGMAGKHFCVSFARPDDADICLQIGQSIMWDNGAFTSYRQGVQFDHNAYYAWLEPRLGHPHWAVIPDVIDGPVEQQKSLLAEWPYPNELAAPVWHMGLPIDYLLFLCDRYPRVCFGSSGKYWLVESDAWSFRADKAFNALAKAHRFLPHIHMLRGLALTGKRWPFASADSVNVARNFKDRKVDAETMARRLDAVQTPLHWQQQPELQELAL
tara:strand:- start:3 stop:698 length:696 start_codon:yes stop_codon:yes gene_type:complete